MPLGALGIAGLISGGTSLIQTGLGLFNKNKARSEYNKLMANQPKFETPSGVTQAVNTAAAAYQGGLPTYDIAEQNIAATTSRGVDVAEKSAGSGQELQGTTQALFARELENLNALNVQDIQYREAARRDYINALLSKGQYEAQAQEQKFNIWQMKLNREAERAGYGQQMVMQGIGGLVGAAGQYFTNEATLSQLRLMFPQESFKDVTKTLSGGVKWNNIDDALYRGRTEIYLPTNSYYTWP